MEVRTAVGTTCVGQLALAKISPSLTRARIGCCVCFVRDTGPDVSLPSLGLVNALEMDDEEEDDEETRIAIGEGSGSSTTKWHKHTVKVLTMLQRNIKGGTATDGSDNEEDERPTQLSYNQLSQNCSRRTAAGVFFELLQLKTWDFIELNQDEAYGDVAIAAGERFAEAPPDSV